MYVGSLNGDFLILIRKRTQKWHLSHANGKIVVIALLVSKSTLIKIVQVIIQKRIKIIYFLSILINQVFQISHTVYYNNAVQLIDV